MAQHPLKVGTAVLLLSPFYSFARVLTLQYAIGALQDAIVSNPKNFPHAFFLPLFHVFLAIAAAASLYQDYFNSRFSSSTISTQLWKHVLPLPLTLHHGKWSRLVGIPLYAFIIAVVEAMLVINDPTIASVVATFARSFFRRDYSETEFYVLTEEGAAAKRPVSSVLSYIRFASEVFLASVVCASFALARLFCEPQYDGDELREAVRSNDILGVKLLLARGMNADACSRDGTTALHVCGQQAVVRAAQVLLEHGANANVKDQLGFTPLHWAVQMRREEVSSTNRLMTIRILLRHGANPREPDSSGATPLLIASRKENEASLAVLKDFLPGGSTGEIEIAETRNEASSGNDNSE